MKIFKRLLHCTGFIVVLFLCAAIYTKVFAKIGSGTPPEAASAYAQADRILVSKADKQMYLFRGPQLLKSYRIVMGRNWNEGHKQREGDERTPEGLYEIDWRNAKSIAHLSLHISYPNAADRDAASQGGYSPGGNIMIHGLPNGWGGIRGLHRFMNWTDGCIAVTNDEMREIWSLVPDRTPIEIVPGSLQTGRETNASASASASASATASTRSPAARASSGSMASP